MCGIVNSCTEKLRVKGGGAHLRGLWVMGGCRTQSSSLAFMLSVLSLRCKILFFFYMGVDTCINY